MLHPLYPQRFDIKLSLRPPRTRPHHLLQLAMPAPAATTTPKKVSKFSVSKAATPQGKRNVAETVVKGQAPEIPKASKVICAPPPRPRCVCARASVFLLSLL